MRVPGDWRASSIRLTLELLDRFPWAMGEACCAAMFVARAVVSPRRMEKALTWAAHHPQAGRSRWRAAVSTCAYQGRFRARHALLGLRSPNELLERVRLVGGQHLPPAGGALLLGFHLGPPAIGAALCAAGHRVLSIEGRRASRSWSSAAWEPVRRTVDPIPLAEEPAALAATLYLARTRLLEGETVYMAADGARGRLAFVVTFPGGTEHPIRAGWLRLRRDCRVPVLPVVGHMDGRTQVITIHPPLPAPDPDPARDMVVCRDAVTAILDAFVRRFPEQCCGLVYDAAGR